MHGFIAKLVATEGLLLGGNKEHFSSAFESKESALDWAKAAIQANLEDRRKVKFEGYIETNFIDIFDDQILTSN